MADKQNSPRILSIRQPWAWAIAEGSKRVENRSWSTPYRGPVLIHASSRLERDALDFLRRQRVTPPAAFDFSAVVAIADLIDVVTEEPAARLGRWFFGPYGLVFDNVQKLRRPIAVKGKLGLARVEPALARRVRAELRY